VREGEGNLQPPDSTVSKRLFGVVRAHGTRLVAAKVYVIIFYILFLGYFIAQNSYGFACVHALRI